MKDSLKKSIVFTLLVAIFIAGAVLRIYNLTNISSRSPDEGIYTYQAGNIVQYSPEGVKLLVQSYNSDKRQWIYPPPTRVGYLWLLANVMRMTNTIDVNIGSNISCFFSILSLAILTALGLKFFNEYITLYALAFMSVSPLDLAIARRTWQDAMLGSLGLLLIYFCCEITRDSTRRFWYILFAAVGSYCMLIKESGAVIYVLCAIWLFWVLFIKEKSLPKGIFLAACIALGTGISLTCLFYAAGGVSPVLEVLGHVKEAMPMNTYAVEYQSGPWYQFLGGFWIMSPINAILCSIGIIGTFLFFKQSRVFSSSIARDKRNAISGIIIFATSLIAITIAAPYCQNLRYVSVLFVPFYLLGGLGLWYIVSTLKDRLNRPSFCGVIALVVIMTATGVMSDYQRFRNIFIKTGIKDTSIRLLREASRL